MCFEVSGQFIKISEGRLFWGGVSKRMTEGGKPTVQQ